MYKRIIGKIPSYATKFELIKGFYIPTADLLIQMICIYSFACPLTCDSNNDNYAIIKQRVPCLHNEKLVLKTSAYKSLTGVCVDTKQ
jgi:hypothetical protein